MQQNELGDKGTACVRMYAKSCHCYSSPVHTLDKATPPPFNRAIH